MSDTTFTYSNGSLTSTSQTSNATISSADITPPGGYSLVGVNIGTSCTAVADDTFNGQSQLSTVTFDEREGADLTLGQYAFYNCDALLSIAFPEGMTGIGGKVEGTGRVFLDCNSLATITIPNSMLYIGWVAFQDCGITTINIDPINSALTEVCGYAFYQCFGLTSIQLPVGVKYLGDLAFGSCSGLTSVEFANQHVFLGNSETNPNPTWGFPPFAFIPGNPTTVTYYLTTGQTGEGGLSAPSLALQTTLPSYTGTAGFDYVYTTAAACFNKGTKILAIPAGQSKEAYVAIEQLREGDLVCTYKHGQRKITKIGHSLIRNDRNNITNAMYVMRKKEGNGLTEDLYLTGGHGVLVANLGRNLEVVKSNCKGQPVPTIDGLFIEPVHLNAQFRKFGQINQVFDIYQMTLENDGNDDARYGVFANGLLVETPSVNQLKEFQLIPLGDAKVAAVNAASASACSMVPAV